ncbi:hypothetical protein SmJEL517_g04304 [Synchytrium microbalum]|uniref:Uncharacterized protein n=1 Tax=Synchytrium microbalum TaxID=1806994 RepID=A0A507BUG9_9FUNG|nr:uncharacterized protein SmJEL517_g04304 [Synchytrium microbalum]TPX32587.1 hypothetical protein SmJEL517_g04304 [Synchytrium microbalum]
MAGPSRNSTVRLQEPISLTANTINTAYGRAGRAVLKQVSFVASEQDKERKRAVVTIQGAGIFIYDLATQLPIHSWSVSPDTRFACAARQVYPYVYAVVQVSPDLAVQKAGRLVWSWNTSVKNTTGTDTPKELWVDHPVHSIHKAPNDTVLLVHTNLHMSLYSQDFSRKLASYAPSPSSSTDHQEVIHIQGASGWIVAKTAGRLHVYNLEVNTVGGLYEIACKSLGDVHYESDVVAVTIQSDKLIVTLSSGKILVYKVATSGMALMVTISVQYLDLVLKPDHLDVVALDEHHIAVTACRKNGSQYEGLLMVWDTKYGTLQIDKPLTHLEGPRAQFPIKYSIALTNSPLTGPSLLIACSSSSKGAAETDVHLFPYMCAKPTLLSALGKLQRPAIMEFNSEPESTQHTSLGMMTPIVATPPTIPSETDFLSQLMNPTQTPDDETFERVFVTMVMSKLGKPMPESGHVRLGALAITDIAQPSLLLLLTRCFASPATFFPHHVINYLLSTGAASSRSIPGGIISPALERGDLKLLEMALRRVVDLSESEVVDALMYVCGADKEAWISTEERIVMMDEVLSKRRSRKASRAVNDGNDTTVAAASNVNMPGVSRGQNHFLELIFSAPRTRDVFQRCMKRIRIQELEVLLNWILNTIQGMSASSTEEVDDVMGNNLWWMWSSKSSSFIVAIEALTILLDAHSFNMILTPALHDKLNQVTSYLSTSISTFQTVQSRLSGPLQAFIETKPTSLSVGENGNGYGRGKNWARLVANANDGVGMYSIEMVTI